MQTTTYVFLTKLRSDQVIFSTRRFRGNCGMVDPIIRTQLLSSLCHAPLRIPQRPFALFSKAKPIEMIKLNERVFDKQYPHFYGYFLGIPADTLIFYLKVGCGLFILSALCFFFVKGYIYSSRFSTGIIARMSFVGGFLSCTILMTLAVIFKRRFTINANAVYNQSISMVLRNDLVVKRLGQYPKTGKFQAYCHSGGFKLPLLRRLRSGNYKFEDILGSKPRQLKMIFTLTNANNCEGVVMVEVIKERSGWISSANVFRTLAIKIRNFPLSVPQRLSENTKSPQEPNKVASDSQTIMLVGTPNNILEGGFPTW